MTTIYIDPIGTTTSLSVTSTIEDIRTVDNDTLTTTIASAITTSALSPAYADCDMTNRYLDSLTDTQLIEMEQKLAAKDMDYSINVGDTEIGIDLPKIYAKKGTK